MKTEPGRTPALWRMDRALLIAGAALLAASPLWWPWLLAPAWAALGLGLFVRLTESSEPSVRR